MSNDKEKLLQIMASLESDYAHGKISKEKYVYFRSKYEDRLNALDAREATNRIRSMQGKPSDSPNNKKPIRNEKREDEDLVQKYIINPKKGDKQIEPKAPMDSGTFKLVAILILAIGFTVGAGFGVFNFDFLHYNLYLYYFHFVHYFVVELVLLRPNFFDLYYCYFHYY